MTFNPNAILIANCKFGENKYIILAGAGVSKDAGLPTGWDLMLATANVLYAAECPGEECIDLNRWFETSEYAQMSYSEIMDQLYRSPITQRDFLQKFLGKREPGKAHNYIADLVKRQFVRAIVTTNFDRCIEMSIEQIGLPIQVIASDEDVQNSPPLIQSNEIQIYKPHGTIERGHLRNTPKDLESLDP